MAYEDELRGEVCTIEKGLILGTKMSLRESSIMAPISEYGP